MLTVNLFLVTIYQAAQPARQGSAREQLLILCGVLIALCLAGGVVILLMRRRLMSKESSESASASLMEQLRAMRDRGEMTPEEFEKTRQAMIRKVRSGPGSGPAIPPR